MTATRRLVAILAVDDVGASRLMGEAEDRTLSRLRGLLRNLLDDQTVQRCAGAAACCAASWIARKRPWNGDDSVPQCARSL
jgi:class 3 adenylate cyclase